MGAFLSNPVAMDEKKDGVSAFEPSLMDVLVARAMLQRGLALPTEIVDVIWEYAEYWPHVTAEVDFRADDGYVVHGGNRGIWRNEDTFLLRSRPLGFIKVPHPNPDTYLTTAIEPRRLSKEHTLEDYQKWIASPVDIIARPCRKIVFTIVSRDQGWGGAREDQGTYNGSYSWFDVGLERFDADNTCHEGCPDGSDDSAAGEEALPNLPICSLRPIIPEIERQFPYNEEDRSMIYRHDLLASNTKLQCNVVASKEYREHRIEWNWTDSIDPDSEAALELERQGRGKATANGEFVRNLKPGDVVTLWAKARFPGWSNNIQSAKMDVYWAF